MHQTKSFDRKFWLLSLLLVTLLVLVGYHHIFVSGANTFFKEDWVAVSSHTYGNKLSNGWRADRGLGISNFFGDPAMWHPWGPLSWFEKIAPSQTFAYDFTVVAFSIIAAIVFFIAIRRMYPQFNVWIAIILAPTAVFATDQSGYYLARAFTPYVGTIPLGLILLYQFLETKKPVYYFYFSLLSFYLTFFGTIWCLTQMMSIGFVFTCGYCYYFKKNFWKCLKDLLVLYTFTLIATIGVGAWAFYSFFYEKIVVGYVREKLFIFNSNLMPNFKGLIQFIQGLVVSEYMPQNNLLAGFWSRQPIFSFLPFFPMVFWLSFRVNTKSFWSFIIRFLICVWLAYLFMFYANFPPLIVSVINYISVVTSKVITPYDFVLPMQLLILVDFLIAFRSQKDMPVDSIFFKISRVLAWGVVLFYSALLVVILGAYINAQTLANVFLGLIKLVPQNLMPADQSFISAVISYNVSRITETYRPYAVLYVVTTIILSLPFLKSQWLNAIRRIPLSVIAVLVLSNAFFLSWGIFPLNQTKLFWEEFTQKEQIRFQPTDRFYYVKDATFPRTIEGFNQRWGNVSGLGHKERILGVEQPPALNFSGFKSFTTKREREFIDKMFNSDGEIKVTKRLYYGAPLIGSDLMNLAAVNYYFSENKYTDLPDGVVSIYDSKGMHIYKNLNAWPYFYLAESLQTVSPGEILSNPQRGNAYVEDDDLNFKHSQSSTVEMTSFKSGEMTFKVSAKSQEFLVVADAWHPLWKATIDGKDIAVLKANFIFKGVSLPPGDYNLVLVFDSSVYKTGVIICLVSLMLFVIGFIVAIQKSKSKLSDSRV